MNKFHRKINHTIKLMPASLLLGEQQAWRALASGFPLDGFLFVLPADNGKVKQTMLKIARTARSKGQQVAFVTAW